MSGTVSNAKTFLLERFYSRKPQSFTPIQNFGFQLYEHVEIHRNFRKPSEDTGNNDGRLITEPPVLIR